MCWDCLSFELVQEMFSNSLDLLGVAASAIVHVGFRQGWQARLPLLSIGAFFGPRVCFLG